MSGRLPATTNPRDNRAMQQMGLFTAAEVTAMRDRTRRRNYSPQAEAFRRDHEKRRAFGLKQRHALRERRLRDGEPVSHNGFLVHRHPAAPAGTDPQPATARTARAFPATPDSTEPAAAPTCPSAMATSAATPRTPPTGGSGGSTAGTPGPAAGTAADTAPLAAAAGQSPANPAPLRAAGRRPAAEAIRPAAGSAPLTADAGRPAANAAQPVPSLTKSIAGPRSHDDESARAPRASLFANREPHPNLKPSTSTSTSTTDPLNAGSRPNPKPSAQHNWARPPRPPHLNPKSSAKRKRPANPPAAPHHEAERKCTGPPTHEPPIPPAAPQPRTRAPSATSPPAAPITRPSAKRNRSDTGASSPPSPLSADH